jgi:branched-chain amino acid transport system permease protein
MSLALHQVVNAFVLGSIYSLLSVSLTFTYSISRVVNLAQGDLMMVGAYAGYVASKHHLDNIAAMLVIGIVVAAVAGWLASDLIFRWVRDHGYISLVAGVALSSVIEEALRLSYDSGNPVAYPRSLVGRGLSDPKLEITVVGVAVVLGTAFHLYVSRSSAGRAMRATSDDARVARLLGIPTERMVRLSFIVGAGLAGGAGVLLALTQGYVTPSVGSNVEFVAVAVILFGGLGSIPGAVVGSIVVGFAEVFSSTYLSSSYRDAFTFALIIIVMIVRPAGLFGRLHVRRA